MNASRVTKFAFLLAVATLVVGLSACDQLVSILTSGDMPDGEIPDEMGMMTGLPMGIAMYRSWTSTEKISWTTPTHSFGESRSCGSWTIWRTLTTTAGSMSSTSGRPRLRT